MANDNTVYSGLESSVKIYKEEDHTVSVEGQSEVLTCDNRGSAEQDVALNITPNDYEVPFDFANKVAGSMAENGNKAFEDATLYAVPSTPLVGTEFTQLAYDKIEQQDRVTTSTSTALTDGLYANQQNSYDLSTSISNVDKLRTYTREIDINYFGYGSGVNAGADNHEAEVLAWNRSLNGGVGGWESQGYAGASFSRASEATVENAVFTEVLNFAGKTAGSTAVCPHVAKQKDVSTFDAPNTFTSEFETGYERISSSGDLLLATTSTSTSGYYSQHLFSFDLLAWLRNRFPYIGSIDLATAKTITKKIEATVVCSGSGEGGNGATLKSWNGSALVNPQTHTAATPSPLVISLTDMVTGIDSAGFAHFVAHSTNPADADTPSLINTDYPQLAVTVDLSTIKANQPRYVGSNYALEFDGVSSRVVLPPLPLGKDTGTLEMWINVGNLNATENYAFYHMASTDSRLYVRLNGDTRVLTLGLANGGFVVPGYSIPASGWVHYALTYSNAVWKFLANGSEVATGAYGGSINTCVSSYIGSSDTGYYLKGIVKDARIWNVDRSSQIAANMHTLTDTTGLVARYACAEGAGLIVNDSAPRINLLTKNQSNGGEDGTTTGFASLGDATLSTTTEEKWQGNTSIKVQVTQANYSGVSPMASPIPVTPNKSYTISAYVKAPAGKLVYLRTQNPTSPSVSAMVTGNDEWQKITLNITPTTSLLSCRFDNNMGTDDRTFTFYIDAIQINEGSTAAGWVEGGEKYPYNGVISGATWVAGNAPPFGKGILIEEGTTNLFNNNTFATDVSVSGTTPVLTVVDEPTAITGKALKIKYTEAIGTSQRLIVPQLAGESYSISFYAKGGTGTVGKTVRAFDGLDWGVLGELTSEYKRYTHKSTGVATQTSLGIGGFITASNDEWYIHSIQVEKKPYPTSFTPTTRQPDRLTLPASVLNEAEGEISVWAYEDGVSRSAYLIDASIPNAAPPGRMLMSKNVSKYIVYFNNSLQFSVNMPSIGQHLHKLVWKGPYVAYVIDGIVKGEKTLSSPVTFSGVTKVFVGCNTLQADQYNSPIDNLVIRNKTQATPEAIAAQAALEYTQGQVLPDGNTTYCQDFDGTLAAVCPFEKRITQNVGNYIDDNGDTHVLVRSRYPSDGIKPAAVYTDYTDLRTKTAYVQNPKITRMGPNLLQDPSFEQGGKWGTYDATRRMYGDAKDGSYFMRETYAWRVWQEIPVQAGKNYAISFWSRKAKGAGNGAKPRASITIGSSAANVYGVDSPEWTLSKGVVAVPTGVTSVRIYFITGGSSEDLNTNASDFDCIYFGEVESLTSPVPDYIDSPPTSLQYIGDLALTDYLSISKDGEIDGNVPIYTPNLISNPVFVQNESYWTKVSTPSIRRDKSYLGGKSAYVDNTKTYTQTINVTAGKEYSFAAYYLASIANAVGKLTITWSTETSNSATLVADTDTWKRLKLENQIAPVGATTVTIKIESNTSDSVYVDAVQCTQTPLCPDFALRDCSLILQDGKLTIPENSLSQIRLTTTSGACKTNLTYAKPSDTEYVQGFVESFNVNEKVTYKTIPKGLRSLHPADFKPMKVDTTFTMGKLWHDTELSSFAKPSSKYTIKYEAETEDKLNQVQKQTHTLSGCVFTDWGLQSPEDDLCRESVSGQAVKHFTL